ncbi:MAG TPA: hypothetical protein VMT20_27800 [Terriglobia bacterium]|nr:hypothetical protein [Terriglobia bacterium]
MITTHIHAILVVVGLVTMGGIGALVAPRQALKLVFGVETPQNVALLLTRHWGLLIFLVGALLTFAAYHPGIQVPAMAIAGLEKIAFAGLVFLGPLKRTTVATLAAAVDAGFAVLFVLFFMGL